LAVGASLFFSAWGDLLFLSWLTFAFAVILILAASFLMPTKTAHGINSYRLALDQCQQEANKNWVKVIAKLQALGLMHSWQPLMKSRASKTPAWYEDSRLTADEGKFYLYLQELQELLAATTPLAAQQSFSLTRSPGRALRVNRP